MSKVAIAGNASGTGVFTIASPNSNTDRTLTLPDSAGNIVLDSATQTLTNKSIAASQLTGTLSNDRLPSGTVLRTYFASFNGGTQVNSGTGTDIGLNFSNVVINAGEAPILFVQVSSRLISGSQHHSALKVRYTGSATGIVGHTNWGFGIWQGAGWSWVIHNISGVNLKQARANPFNSTGTFNFFMQGQTAGDTVQFGGEQSVPTAGYGPSQGTILIVKE